MRRRRGGGLWFPAPPAPAAREGRRGCSFGRASSDGYMPSLSMDCTSFTWRSRFSWLNSLL
jgi:hypothetical protein